jgi:glycosyltransferase involved in cell wall biosynthesis
MSGTRQCDDPQQRTGDLVRETPVVVSLIVPCYNGEAGLVQSLALLTEWQRQQVVPTEVILSDDGSNGAAADLMDRCATETAHVRVVRSTRNLGKGNAVRLGLAASRGAYCIFLDSDLAYPLSEIAPIVAALEAGADVVIANRLAPDSRYEMRPAFITYLFSRHLGSRLFNRLIQLILLRGVPDTQAGLKGFRRTAAQLVVDRSTVTGFAFDVEALVIATLHACWIRQIAVTFRYDSESSTVRYFRDAWRMSRDLLRIRLNVWRGVYA